MTRAGCGAARAVAHSIPFLTNEAGFFKEEGIGVEVVRTLLAEEPAREAPGAGVAAHALPLLTGHTGQGEHRLCQTGFVSWLHKSPHVGVAEQLRYSPNPRS